MTKISCFLLCFFPVFAFATDCEAYKRQVINDCDAIYTDYSRMLSKIYTIKNNAYTIVISGATSGTDSGIVGTASQIMTDASNVESYLMSQSQFVLSIKNTAQNLNCTNTTGTCDCSTYLQSVVSLLNHISTVSTSLDTKLQTVQTDLSTVMDTIQYYFPTDQGYGDIPSLLEAQVDWLGDIYNRMWDIEDMMELIRLDNSNIETHLNNIETYLNLVNADVYKRAFNNLANLNLSILTNDLVTSYLVTSHDHVPSALPLYSARYSSNGSGVLGVTFYRNTTSRLDLYGILQMLGIHYPGYFASINNGIYSNSVQNLTFFEKNQDSFSSFTNRFSIFADNVLGNSPVLLDYVSQQVDGTYHAYLTNYYIRVSGSSVSGSTPLTNWFNRIEMLLAALVFKDSDGTINTNGIPSDSDKNSVGEIGSSLDQTISGFVQEGNTHISSVDTSGKSIIRMVTSWNSAIGQTSKPAPFVVAEFSSPGSQSRSNISLYFDTEDERLSSLIEIGHGISTLTWVALFLMLGYNLAVYSIRVLRKLISFSFSLYSAIFGGG